jgi:signal peptidase I
MLAGLLVVSLVISAGLLWLCARMVRAGHPSFKRALACSVVPLLVGVAANLILAIFPTNPETALIVAGAQEKKLFVKRLLGLPGEKLEIKDEAVWINGQKWTPPPELSGLIYTGWATGTLPDERAKEPRSWDLGPDDFFVLGDFTTNSDDSRRWGPVPRANLVGVATLIYWPPRAWRILR